MMDTDRTNQGYFDIDVVPNEEASPEMEKLEPFKLEFKAIEPQQRSIVHFRLDL